MSGGGISVDSIKQTSFTATAGNATCSGTLTTGGPPSTMPALFASMYRKDAADPAPAAMGSSGSTSQLVQAMAGFGGGSGAADGSSTPPLNADASQQQFLTTPHA